MRFSLRTMLVGVAVVAVILAWLVAQRNWVADRKEAREWAQNHRRVNLVSNKDYESLPLGVRLWGDWPMEYFELDADHLDETEIYRIEELRRLFPEARIIVKRSGKNRIGVNGLGDLLAEVVAGVHSWAAELPFK